MAGPPLIQEFNFHSDLIFLKPFIMNSIQHRRLLTISFCFALFFLFACNSTNKEEQKSSDSNISNDHAQTDTLPRDNEVKAEAPDANNKAEQGYALPRHTEKLAQSPIDIISLKADNAGKEQISFAFHSDINAAKNLGHTIELEFKEGSTCMVNGKNYTCRQFHFHTPSEHLVDGITFPMEMHIVNTLTDSANGNRQSYLVLAVLFRIGAENKFIKEFLNKIPNEEGEENTLQPGDVKLDDLFSQFTGNDIKSYYTYQGSLTTPPFTESVQWVILKHIVEASEDQIMAIEKMEGNNARHVQAINDRKIYSE
jgi:carbonic anhydrase